MALRPIDLPTLDAERFGRYLDRLELTAEQIGDADRAALDTLCLAHLTHVPFENLDQVFADGVPHELDAATDKVLAGRGGWCFELNGAFARLLTTIGYDVRLLGCAVLLDGPSRRIEHLALEVAGGRTGPSPLFVDVGFGDSIVFPLELNRSGPQPGGNGDYEFLSSPEGTTLAKLVDGVPDARLRFKRVAHDFADFAPAAERLQTDPSLSWSSKPFATRLVAPDHRITLRDGFRTKSIGDDVATEPVATHEEWDRTLRDWFGLERPGPWPDVTTGSCG